jgi:hypothetical protein
MPLPEVVLCGIDKRPDEMPPSLDESTIKLADEIDSISRNRLARLSTLSPAIRVTQAPTSH